MPTKPNELTPANRRGTIGRPAGRRVGYHEGHGLPVDGGIGLVEVEVRWDLTIFQGQNNFYQTCDTGRGFEMPNIGLDGPQNGALAIRLVRTKNSSQRLYFDWISERRTGAVRLDVSHFPGRHRRGLQRGAYDPFLGRGARGC